MKKHLATFRKGWQGENLARYILSNFTFVAHPSSIADDIGSDFFCTIFNKVSHEKRDYLIPKESFAIQTKSNNKKFSIDGKIEYLKSMNIPFFVGFIDEKKQELNIYSGEYLIPFFADEPEPKKVKINLCQYDANNQPYFKQSDTFIVNFPKLVTIGINTDTPSFRDDVNSISEACRTISGNIARRNNGEFIFADSFNRGFILIENKQLIKESIDHRLLKVRRELSYIIENNKIDTDLSKYELISKSLMKL